MNTEETIKQLIADVIDKLSVPYERIERVADAPQPLFTIRTKESGALIGTRGENLRALNVLVKRMAERRFAGAEEQPRFVVDVNNYEQKRIGEIQQRARLLAERARTFQYDIEMSPMSPYERMIVHATFSEINDIETESRGEGRMRRVIIKHVAPEAARSGAPGQSADLDLVG